MRLFLAIAFLFFMSLACEAQSFKVDTIFFSGKSEKFINIVILPDGYQESELAKFKTDAEAFVNVFFTVQPFDRYSNYFNVFIVNVPSNESGADHPGTATDVTEPAHEVQSVDNYFGSTFDYFDIHRLLVPLEEGKIFSVLANNVPLYDQAIILANTPYYGGSGGTFATASLHSQSIEVTIHELGHSFAGLSDEYYAGDFYAGENVNMTKETDPEKVRWKNWIGTNEVGIYQHCCSGNSAQWYRPHQSCKMRMLGAPFCSVCQQAIVERIHRLVSPVNHYYPESLDLVNENETMDFNVDLINPQPNTLHSIWELNGEITGVTGEEFSLNGSELLPGLNFLAVYVEDTSELIRVDGHDQIHLSSVVWSIDNNELSTDKIQASPYNISIKLYPNPISDVLNITIESDLPKGRKFTIELYDITGKKLKHFSATNNDNTSINLDEFASGTYGVNVYDGKLKVGSKKIIIK